MRSLKYIFLYALFGAFCNAASAGIDAVKDRLKNDPYMVPFYTGKILPFPREARYHDDFFPLSNTGILLGSGLVEDDPRVKLLLNRIAQYGGNYKFIDSMETDCETIFAAGENTALKMPTPPGKPQGYAIKSFKEKGKNIVAFAGHDHLGLTWAVNSLIQMITLRDGETVMHAVDVNDYPFMTRRGTKGPGVHDYPAAARIYPVMTKLDRIQFAKSILVPRRGSPREWIDWRTPRPEELTDKVAAIGESLRGLGIEWDVGIMPFAIGDTINEQVQVDSKSDEHFEIVWKMCEPVLKAGGGISYTPDDYRFPISPEDAENFGTARDADVYFMNRLYARIKESYPDAGLSMVGPFYWGPRTKNPWSDESPIEYLKALGEHLPPDINIAWTGPSVKTGGFTKEHVEKFSTLIKRKPYFFQNSSDRYHFYRYIYLTDVLSWWLNEGRDRDVYLELSGASFNSLGLYPDMLWSAMLWNPDGYDAEKAARHATGKLIGPESWDAAKKFVESLSYFDQFSPVGNLSWLFWVPCRQSVGELNRYAARNIDALEAKLTETEQLYEELLEINRVAVEKWSRFPWYLRVVQTYVERIQTDDAFSPFRKAPAQRERAQKAGDYLPENDFFLAASNFEGILTEIKENPIDDLLGSDDDKLYPALVLSEEAKTLTTKSSQWFRESDLTHKYELLVSARKGPNTEKLTVSVNDTELFNDAVPFSEEGFSTIRVSLPDDLLKEDENILQIGVIASAGKFGEQPGNIPLLAIQYAVFKMKGK